MPEATQLARVEVRLDSKLLEGTAHGTLTSESAAAVQMEMKITLNLVLNELIFL